MPKTGIIISDLHCGHLYGLTPPAYWVAPDDDHAAQRAREWEEKTWNWYAQKVREIGHVDKRKNRNGWNKGIL